MSALGALSFAILVSCGQTNDRGRAVYDNPDPNGNTFACSTCHAISEPSSDPFRRAGHPLAGSTDRPTYKNGNVASLLEAVNSCRSEWMNTRLWTSDDTDWIDLYGWLQSLPPDHTEPVTFQLGLTEPPQLSGNSETGRSIFNATCAACHGIDASGTNLAPGLRGDLLAAQGGADYIARRVRTSGLESSPVYDGLTGGRMPFWSVDRLSDQELADIIAYLSTAEGTQPISTGIAGLDTPGDCAKTHPIVGQTAELETFFHGVAGTATILNDCTIRMDNFYYDGAGIDVRLYGGIGGDYSAGFPIGPDLIRNGGYDGETLYFVLTDQQSLDDLNGVSVWCVDVAADFGSGLFK